MKEEYPIEEELEEAYKEIERLNKIIDKYDKELTHKTHQYEYLRHYYNLDEREAEIERLNNIIKEVREYITSIKDEDIQYTIGWVKQDILQILDKE